MPDIDRNWNDIGRHTSQLAPKLSSKLRKTFYHFYSPKIFQENRSDKFSLFSRVLRDSTPRFVRPSVGRSVGPHFTFFIRFTFLTSPLLPKWSSDLKYGPCPPARPLPTRTRLRQPCIRPYLNISLYGMWLANSTVACSVSYLPLIFNPVQFVVKQYRPQTRNVFSFILLCSVNFRRLTLV